MPEHARHAHIHLTPRGAPAPFTCGGCEHTWRGYRMAHCPTCHNTFGSVSSFDRHRKNGECLPAGDLGLFWNNTRQCWSELYSTTTLKVDNAEED